MNDQWNVHFGGEIFEAAGRARTCGGIIGSAGNSNTGFGTNTGSAATPVAQTLWEITPTLQYCPVKPLILRVEYRHDKSDRNVFVREQDAVNHQQTISFQAVYVF